MTRTLAAICVFALLASGCIAYPKNERVDVYEGDCHIEEGHLTLGLSVADSLNCSGGQPGACLALIAATGVATTVVSGSIVVVGNTMYWLEKKGRCSAKRVAESANRH